MYTKQELFKIYMRYVCGQTIVMSDEVTNLGTTWNANCQLQNLNVGREGVVRGPEKIHEYIRLANNTVL